MTAPVSQVLSEAADLLEKPGAWGQGDYRPKESCFCVLGAIRYVGGFTADFNPPTDAFRSYIGGGMVCDWNDEPGRTQQEVVDALRRAAALAKEQGR